MRIVVIVALSALFGATACFNGSDQEKPPPPRRMVFMDLRLGWGNTPSQRFTFTASPGDFSQTLGVKPSPEAITEDFWQFEIRGRILEIEPDRVRVSINVQLNHSKTRQAFSFKETVEAVPGQALLLQGIAMSNRLQALTLMVYVIPGVNDPEKNRIYKLSPPSKYLLTSSKEPESKKGTGSPEGSDTNGSPPGDQPETSPKKEADKTPAGDGKDTGEPAGTE